jgi:peptidoglycan/LPS O-acetylase OafA/YrhL
MEHSKRGPVLPHFVASLFYVHNLVYHQVSSINSVAWSLEVEVQFYILMPLFALFFRIPGRLLRRGAMLAVIVLAVSLQSWLIPNVFVIDLTLAGQIQHFFVGILLADIFLLDWSEQPISEPIWDLLVVAAIVVFFGSHAISPVCYRLALPAVTFMLMFATFRGAFWRRALRITMISLVGGMCYSIYLLHQPIISMIGRRTLGLTFGHSFALNVLVQFPIWAAVTLLICVIFFVLVERPCMDKNWPMKLLRVVRLGFRKETPQPSVAQTSPTASVASRSTPS